MSYLQRNRWGAAPKYGATRIVFCRLASHLGCWKNARQRCCCCYLWLWSATVALLIYRCRHVIAASTLLFCESSMIVPYLLSLSVMWWARGRGGAL